MHNLNRDLLVLADFHFASLDDVKVFKEFIQTLEPKKTTLLLLGDIFDSWMDSKRTFEEKHTYFLQILFDFKNQGGLAYMVAGNRDIFFYKKRKYLPFDKLNRDQIVFNHNGKKILALHGDVITEDKEYLFVRKWLLQPYGLLNLLRHFIVTKTLRKMIAKTEQTIKKRSETRTYKFHFPEKTYQRYICKMQRKQHADFIFIGHFHLPKIQVYLVEQGKSIIIPDWLSSYKYVHLQTEDYKEYKFETNEK